MRVISRLVLLLVQVRESLVLMLLHGLRGIICWLLGNSGLKWRQNGRVRAAGIWVVSMRRYEVLSKGVVVPWLVVVRSERMARKFLLLDPRGTMIRQKGLVLLWIVMPFVSEELLREARSDHELLGIS
jgi:hypothetical protein